jgi:hypothetical protein
MAEAFEFGRGNSEFGKVKEDRYWNSEVERRKREVRKTNDE